MATSLRASTARSHEAFLERLAWENFPAHTGLRGQQSHNGERSNRLPRAGLPYQAKHFSWRDAEADIAYRGKWARGCGKLDRQVPKFEQHTHMLAVSRCRVWPGDLESAMH